MSNSEEYSLVISFNQRVPGIKLHLSNGGFVTMYDAESLEAELCLPQGIYHLKISYLDYFQEKYFSLTENTHLHLNLDYPFTVPALGYATTHEYYSYDAMRFSTEATMKGEDIDPPNFLFFAALYDKDKPSKETAEQWMKHYSLSNIDKTVNIQFNSFNSIFEDEVGKVYFSIYLKPGLYFLNYAGDKTPRIFPMYVYDGYQTQFFIRYAELPDFVNSRIFFSDSGRFVESGEEYLFLEKIICAFSNFKNFEQITPTEMDAIGNHPYLVSLVNILFNVINNDVLKRDDGVKLLSPVADKKQLELPDLIYCNNDQSEVYPLSDKPPLLSSIMIRYTHQLDNEKILFEPASVLDRVVDHINFDIFWNNFSAVEAPDKWDEIYAPLLKTVGQSANPFMRVKNVLINYWKPSPNENLQQLIGKMNLSEAEANTLSEKLSKIKDVSQMSKEFGLPPTTIMRNYQKYSNFYVRVKGSEADEGINADGSKKRKTVIMVISLAAIACIMFISIPGLIGGSAEKTNQFAELTDKEKHVIPLPETDSATAPLTGEATEPAATATAPFPSDIDGFDAQGAGEKHNIQTITESYPRNDTLSVYNALSAKLDLSRHLNEGFNESRFETSVGDQLYGVNIDILNMIKSNPGYLRTALSKSEIDSLTYGLQEWVSAYVANRNATEAIKNYEFSKLNKTNTVNTNTKVKLNNKMISMKGKSGGF